MAMFCMSLYPPRLRCVSTRAANIVQLGAHMRSLRAVELNSGNTKTRTRAPAWQAIRVRRLVARRQRRADRQRAAALPGGEASSGLGRCTRSRRPGGHDGQPRVQRPRRTQHRDQIRARRHSGGRAATGAISGPARLDGRDAHGRAAHRRRRAHASLGWAISAAWARGARRKSRAGHLGWRAQVARVERQRICVVDTSAFCVALDVAAGIALPTC